MSNKINSIVDHYREASEQTRLTSPHGRLEFQRSLAIIEKFLPPPPASVLDVGGAAGVYSLELAERGYQVHLVDPVAKHVQQAAEASAAAKFPLLSTRVGDARCLEHDSNSFDAVLLMGPLYHLLDEADRRAALLETYRVLKPGGVVFAVGISRFASSLDGLSRNLFKDPVFLSIVEQDLATGCHRNPTDNPDYFTDSFFHLPEELRFEVAAAGFVPETLEGIEGPAWLLPDLSVWFDSESNRTILMSLLGMIAPDESLVGVSAHLMAVGRKPSVSDGVVLRLPSCQVRNFLTGDADSLVENANDALVASLLRDGFPHPYTLQDAHRWIAHTMLQSPPTHFAICVDGKAVGGVGFLLQEDVNRKSAEIGYWLGRKHWGKGIASQAVQAAMEFAFENFDLNRVYALAFEGNEASARVLEKCGFQCEGRMRKAVFKNGRFLDQMVYAVVR